MMKGGAIKIKPVSAAECKSILLSDEFSSSIDQIATLYAGTHRSDRKERDQLPPICRFIADELETLNANELFRARYSPDGNTGVAKRATELCVEARQWIIDAAEIADDAMEKDKKLANWPSRRAAKANKEALAQPVKDIALRRRQYIKELKKMERAFAMSGKANAPRASSSTCSIKPACLTYSRQSWAGAAT
jgi:hypothetical protein